jgi:competence protein CoiA
MLTAKIGSGEQVIAWEVERSDGPFSCPACGWPVILRQGRIRVSHFAHAVDTGCQYGTGESAEHLAAKKSIYEALRANERVTKLALERDLTTVRPDISCRIDGIPVAIEVQRSNLRVETVAHRMAEYSQKNIAVLWVLLSAPSTQPIYAEGWSRYDCISLREWQRYLIGLYGSMLAYFGGGDRVMIFQFQRWISERGVGWDGEQNYYFKHVLLENTWLPVYRGTFSLVDDGQSHYRKAWKDVPAAYLWQIRF